MCLELLLVLLSLPCPLPIIDGGHLSWPSWPYPSSLFIVAVVVVGDRGKKL